MAGASLAPHRLVAEGGQLLVDLGAQRSGTAEDPHRRPWGEQPGQGLDHRRGQAVGGGQQQRGVQGTGEGGTGQGVWGEVGPGQHRRPGAGGELLLRDGEGRGDALAAEEDLDPGRGWWGVVDDGDAANQRALVLAVELVGRVEGEPLDLDLDLDRVDPGGSVV